MLFGQRRFLILLAWTFLFGAFLAIHHYRAKRILRVKVHRFRSPPSHFNHHFQSLLVKKKGQDGIHKNLPGGRSAVDHWSLVVERNQISGNKTLSKSVKISPIPQYNSENLKKIPPPSSSSSLSPISSSSSTSSSPSSPLVNDSLVDVQESKSDSNGPIISPGAYPNIKESPGPSIESRSKLTFDQQEIEEHKKWILNKPLYCDDMGSTLDFLIIVNSAVENFEAREAIRETWGKFAVERGSMLLFLLGRSPDLAVIERVIQEDGQHEDILMTSVEDSYYNLTLKSMAMLKWLDDNCGKVKYVLKVDDDMFVNMQLMVDFSETRTFKNAIIGHIAKKWKPHREKKSKWFVPYSVYNDTWYPNFATGPSYLISGDAIGPLYKTAISCVPIFLEDVFITGIVAEKAGIRRLNYSLMKNVKVKVDACTFKRFLTSHKHNPTEIIRLWNEVYEEPVKPCPKVKGRVVSKTVNKNIKKIG